MKYWYFKIKVSEGEPGFCDSSKYNSEKFDSFEKCYKSYLKFDADRYWRHLRFVSSQEIIYVDGDVIHRNEVRHNGKVITDNPLKTLGITKEELIELDVIQNK
jgi:hypothetical protein